MTPWQWKFSVRFVSPPAAPQLRLWYGPGFRAKRQVGVASTWRLPVAASEERFNSFHRAGSFDTAPKEEPAAPEPVSSVTSHFTGNDLYTDKPFRIQMFLWEASQMPHSLPWKPVSTTKKRKKPHGKSKLWDKMSELRDKSRNYEIKSLIMR